MEEVLRDLELGIQELKYLLEIISKDPHSPLRRVALRQIMAMHTHLDALTLKLDQPEEITATIFPDKVEEQREIIEPESLHREILAERLRPAADIMSSLSLNDTFRFSRELFNGDKERMNKVMAEISEIGSLDDILSYLSSELQVGEEDEVMIDFTELLKKYFV